MCSSQILLQGQMKNKNGSATIRSVKLSTSRGTLFHLHFAGINQREINGASLKPYGKKQPWYENVCGFPSW